jgi:hypothetical protein
LALGLLSQIHVTEGSLASNEAQRGKSGDLSGSFAAKELILK